MLFATKNIEFTYSVSLTSLPKAAASFVGDDMFTVALSFVGAQNQPNKLNNSMHAHSLVNINSPVL